MIVQISSGQGPMECELAVGKLFEALKEEYPGIEFLSGRQSRYAKSTCYTSILFSADYNLSELEGSIQWVCRSPYRPNHRRKNWFVDVSILKSEQLDLQLQEADLRFERFHCGGKGGQNVNKVETGVRLTHLPTGIAVTSTAERSQYQNKRRAMEKLAVILRQQEQEHRKKQVNDAWMEHNRIIRGNPVRTYEGMEFTRKY